MHPVLEGLRGECRINRDPMVFETYVLQFATDNAVTTIRIGLADAQSGADLVITHMTTLPVAAKKKGHGGRALKRLLKAATDHGLRHIRATQVQQPSERFFTRHGFTPLHNVTNDFRYQPSG